MHTFSFLNDFSFASSTDEDEILDSVLRDRSHIDETLRLAIEDNAGNYAGKEKVIRLHFSGCLRWSTEGYTNLLTPICVTHIDSQTLNANTVS